VVVTYEAGSLLEESVRSVLADDSAGPVELVVVDNGSRDGSVAALQRVQPDVQVIRAPGNVGYARAANLGLPRRAPADRGVERGHRLEPAPQVHSCELDADARSGACGPRLKNPDGSDYPSARRLPSVFVAVMHGLLGLWWPTNPYTTRYRQADVAPDESRVVDWVSGAALWLRRGALDEVGGWDERYFMYLEDVDLCWRLRGAGWEITYEPAGVVDHVQGASTARTPYRMLAEHHRSAWRFARRRFTGARVLLLPFAAVYLGARGVLAMAAHAWRARRIEGSTG
jgi:N-acetylglucosaminyl-diphospho-decaprenol L-rhamnosyltransferase